MDLVQQINESIRQRLDNLGGEIIRFAETNQSIRQSRGLADADVAAMIGAARGEIDRQIRVCFGAGEGSIDADLRHILSSAERAAAAEKGRAASEIWRQELPGLRQFMEYCVEMIASHPGELSAEVRQGLKCLTEASVVMEKVTARVEQTAGPGAASR